MKPEVSCQKGVTLIELMVAMAVVGVISTAMFAFQQVQTRSYLTQEAFTEMQQNARAAMHFMTREIRMAGCDPDRTAGAGIEEAEDDLIRFTMDFTGPDTPISIVLVPGESFEDDLEYQFLTPDGTVDQSGEDITYRLENGNIVRIDHNGANIPEPIAQNIDALDFVYLDANGDRIDTGASGDLNNSQINRVRAIQVTLLAVSGTGSPGFVYHHTDTTTYRNRWSENDPTRYPETLHIADDNFHRILVSTEIRLRNM